ncbi:MAG: hypothetical protein JAY99_03700 [Candidatus Thiodiazotropha lotti]|uniref:DUF4134 domain-containing protein n=1 Tax=Candidatus Thiodiazotropha endoloripes TaxID=1818881 RepID=A0A1E2ULL0_9GAMM|nr:hypothetical protein [Candidatus Thiodiazotropha endoloripes]MCG7899415.1 hypothetical protein [Candidatus Thiodiazotropha weberae]MCG7992103.1 hypothetical protein [Candidatus Thiodiazotropha lotti]MCG7903981.1 hypothetical protein [Candidatus Thiodiazotropha weberae]MCG7915511.1 hypothetical protein [Candidatus Thiodiazotropha weberae]MCG7998607.1 hypothetical protein [Candidatus Thiodiazotropha lotti]
MKSKLTVALPWVLFVLVFALLTLSDPAMANKFETIGGGVQGSTKIKVEYLITIAYVASAIFMIAGILAIALHNRNAQTLNYTMWKSSAAMFFILSIGMAAAGYYMS